jgi:hypothetical protein
MRACEAVAARSLRGKTLRFHRRSDACNGRRTVLGVVMTKV